MEEKTIDKWSKEETYFTYAPKDPSSWTSFDRLLLKQVRPYHNSLKEAKKALKYFTAQLNGGIRELVITKVQTKTSFLEVAQR